MIMNKTVFLFVIALIWIGLVGGPKNILMVGHLIAASALCLLLANKLNLIPKKNNYKLLSALRYCFWLVGQIILSSISVIKTSFAKERFMAAGMQVIKSNQTNDFSHVHYLDELKQYRIKIELPESYN